MKWLIFGVPMLSCSEGLTRGSHARPRPSRQVINSSPGDLAPVFDAMLEKAMRLCGAAFGHMQTFDGEHWHSAASNAVPEAFADFRKTNPPPYGPGTISARILAGEPLVHTVDLMAEKLYRTGDPNRRALVDLAGARSSLVVPLLKERTVLGVIQIYGSTCSRSPTSRSPCYRTSRRRR
jgi:two-component system NtrC family sensor kinase